MSKVIVFLLWSAVGAMAGAVACVTVYSEAFQLLSLNTDQFSISLIGAVLQSKLELYVGVGFVGGMLVGIVANQVGDQNNTPATKDKEG